jgi:hypothetical protein
MVEGFEMTIWLLLSFAFRAADCVKTLPEPFDALRATEKCLMFNETTPFVVSLVEP